MKLIWSYFKAYAFIEFKGGSSAEKILKKLKESKLDINFVRNVGAKWRTKRKKSKRLKILYRCMIMHLPMQRNQQRIFFSKDVQLFHRSPCNPDFNLYYCWVFKKCSNTCGKVAVQEKMQFENTPTRNITWRSLFALLKLWKE